MSFSTERRVLSGMAQTVLGPVDANKLGKTLLHEHVLCDIRPPDWRSRETAGRQIEISDHWPINYGEIEAPGNLQLDEEDVAIAELLLMKAEGGQTVVDLSCGGLNPNPDGLKRISEATGVHIVMGCGYYVDDYQDRANIGRSADSFAEEMLTQLFKGAWGSDIRAGIIGEIGCQAPWTDLEKCVMDGAAIAMKESGAALSIHPGRHPDQPQEIADFLLERDVDTNRVVISHIDRTIFDDDRLFRLADTGCVIEFDLFGMETSYYKWNEDVDMPNDAQRLRDVRRLIDRGHLDQVAISQDICYRTRLRTFGGHGYGHIFRNVVPIMRRRGFSETEIDQMLVQTPRRILTFK